MNQIHFYALVPLLPLALVSVQLFLADLRSHRLPNRLTYPALIATLVLDIVFGWALRAFELWLTLGFAAVILVFFLIAHLLSRGRFGMGDVKLILLISLAIGPLSADLPLIALTLSFTVFAIYSIALLVFRKVKLATQLPLGPFLIVGAWVTVGLGLLASSLY